MKAARYSLFTVFALSFIGSAIAYKHRIPGSVKLYVKSFPTTNLCFSWAGSAYISGREGLSISYATTNPKTCNIYGRTERIE